MSLSLSATLDLAVWSTSLEAGVVIVPFERLRTWACVYVFGLSFFNVGLKDVTTQVSNNEVSFHSDRHSASLYPLHVFFSFCGL